MKGAGPVIDGLATHQQIVQVFITPLDKPSCCHCAISLPARPSLRAAGGHKAVRPRLRRGVMAGNDMSAKVLTPSRSFCQRELKNSCQYDCGAGDWQGAQNAARGSNPSRMTVPPVVTAAARVRWGTPSVASLRLQRTRANTGRGCGWPSPRGHRRVRRTL